MSGFILFISNIASFLFGFIFIVLVSRNLGQHDLGVWFYIGSIITYFEFFVKVVPYWAIRDFARGREIVKTAITISSIISIPLMISYTILSLLLSSYINVSITVFLVSSLLIPAYYVSASINSILYAKYPHKVGWRIPIIDGLKIPLAIALLSHGLVGVLSAVVIANFLYIFYGLYIVKKEFEKRIDYNWLKSRFKHAWLPLMQSGIGYVNSASDSFLVGTLLSPIQLSLYGIGSTISNAVRASSQLALPFSMKVLAKAMTSREEVTSMIKFLTIFSTPMLIGGILLSRNLYGIFGSIYIDGAGVLWILLLSAVVASYTTIFSGIISGTEKVDYDLDVGFKKLLKSRLFIINLTDYLATAVLLTLSLIFIPILSITGAALSRLTSSLLSFTILAILSLKYIDIKRNLINIGKTIISCIPMSVYLSFFTDTRAIITVLNIFIGATIYFITLCIIDKESRCMVKKFIKELTQKILSILE
ncbi:MAG: polysaccharide biosynthesis C-terminal domain-containing protein [bacterium]|nr:polysaccharide biosynthesis C-terminal domain-containing protein [bacterium]